VTALSDLAVKLAMLPVRSHLRGTPRGISRVRAHKRAWKYKVGDTVSMPGTGGAMRGRIVGRIENPTEPSPAYTDIAQIGEAPMRIPLPEGPVDYVPGSAKYRVEWDDRRVGLYEETELQMVPRRGAVLDITEEMRAMNERDERRRERMFLHQLRQELD
jgi:hypothetical protein